MKSPFRGSFYSIFWSHHEINHPPTVRTTRRILSITREFRIPPLSQQVLNQGVSELNLDTSTCTIQIYLRLMISHQFGHHPKFSWEFPELNQNDSYLSSFKIQDTKQTELQWPAPNHYRYEVGRSKPDRTGFFRKLSVLDCSQVANQSDVSGIASYYKTRKEVSWKTWIELFSCTWRAWQLFAVEQYVGAPIWKAGKTVNVQETWAL